MGKNDDQTVAALYIDPKGSYTKMDGVVAYDGVSIWVDQHEHRYAGREADAPFPDGVEPYNRGDARLYGGPYPVVAHPPCQLWGPFAAGNYTRWGGEHNRPGNDGGCFAAALASVRKWGGVLEHPANSRAWSAFSLRKPSPRGGWITADCGEWVCEVWQSAYGHRAQKRTWLYYCGDRRPLDADWEQRPGTHQCGYPDQRGKARNKPTLGKREASATPIRFAEYLVSLARHSRYPTNQP